uniref:KRAB box domain containing 1 n=1 Tax=Molossus molossus TaxID=27622 RepID=A0A7J8DC71_MOLMO|nr:KRAB box domain containing 1 [Molossus molossus]
MGQPGTCSEGPVQGCDAGELCGYGLPSITHFQTRSDLSAGARERAMFHRATGSPE